MCFEVWVMKECGNKESRSKLYYIPYMKDVRSYPFKKTLHINEDAQMLVDFQKLGC